MKKQYIILVAIFQYIFLIAMVKCQPSFNAPSANCRSYTCKGGKKYLAVPKGKSKYKSSGCKSNGISMFDVNQMAGRKDPVTQCCDLRTACFSICGVSYKYCEKEFKKCSLTLCARELDPTKNEACTRSANLYEMTMKLGGCKNFDDLQAANCDCVIGENRLEKKRLKALATFYKKHNKKFATDEAKLKKLVTKHGVNNNKFAKLVFKMVKKYYPKSINVIVDPQQKMYEEVIKQHERDDAKDDAKDETDTLDGSRPAPSTDKKEEEEDDVETIEIEEDGGTANVHDEKKENAEVDVDVNHDNDDDLVIDLDDE